MKNNFDYFIGIDWSGAKGSSHKGIAVAISSDKNNLIEIVNPKKKYWSRIEIFEYLVKMSSSSRILVGIDFAFSYPFIDLKSYFPDCKTINPNTVFQLWECIEKQNQGQEDLYGGGIWDDEILGEYYNSPVKRGKLYSSRRRLTEIHAKKIRSPSPTFNCVGPAGVGTGTLAGMRLVHKIKTILQSKCCIWPFECNKYLNTSNITMVEIFPSYYFHYAGQSSIKKDGRQKTLLNDTLSFYDQKFISKLSLEKNDNDDMDAVISCAALKYFLNKQIGFSSNFESKELSRASKFEGWIYGVH